MTEEIINHAHGPDVHDRQSPDDQSSILKKQATEDPSEGNAGVQVRIGPRGPLPLRARDQILFAVVCGFALFFMAAYCVRTSHWGVDPIELDRQPERELDYKIELNSATWVEWCQLPGIGPVLAQRIVEDRKNNGSFQTLDDLDRVKGIGPKKIEALRPFVRVELENIPNRHGETSRPDSPPE